MSHKINIPNFLDDATNVYLTKNFIVKQEIIIEEVGRHEPAIISFDTYLKRNPERDFAFRLCYRERENIRGKRLPSNIYTRTYID